MNDYKISFARTVNEQCSKSGVKYQYRGKITKEDADNRINDFENQVKLRRQANEQVGQKLYDIYGIKITNSLTNEIIFEKYVLI